MSNRPSAGALAAKRAFDVVVSAAGLVVLSPVIAAIAVAVRTSSPGPVFYRGVRTGRWGTPFRIHKFRTMVDGAEGLGGGTTALNDARVTPVGRFLRRHKLDELPQLLNVLVGEMSFVGPRPELPQYTAQYTQEERRILSVRPGITDQSSLKFVSLEHEVGGVEADRNYEEFVLPEKNLLRLHYVDNQSFMNDLALVCQTVAQIIRRRPR